MLGPITFKLMLVFGLVFLAIPILPKANVALNKGKNIKFRPIPIGFCVLSLVAAAILLTGASYLMWVGAKANNQAKAYSIAQEQVFDTSLTVENMKVLLPALSECKKDVFAQRVNELDSVPTLFQLNLSLSKCDLFTYNKKANKEDIESINNILVASRESSKLIVPGPEIEELTKTVVVVNGLKSKQEEALSEIKEFINTSALASTSKLDDFSDVLMPMETQDSDGIRKLEVASEKPLSTPTSTPASDIKSISSKKISKDPIDQAIDNAGPSEKLAFDISF